MKERFKFRFFDKVSKEMYYPTEYNGKAEYLERRYDLADMFRFKDLIPMQSTGLKDRNGKLIYEGDILQQPQLPHRFICEWFKCGFWINFRQNGAKRLLDELHNSYEVIGNIYENKELLNGNKNEV